MLLRPCMFASPPALLVQGRGPSGRWQLPSPHLGAAAFRSRAVRKEQRRSWPCRAGGGGRDGREDGLDDTRRALERLLGETEDLEEAADAGSSSPTTPPRPAPTDDPFAPLAEGEQGGEGAQRQVQEGAGRASPPREGFGGRRRDKGDLMEFLDVRNRFEGLYVLVDGIRRGGMSSGRGSLGPGQLVVMRNDIPSLLLWQYQAYEVRSVFWQSREDELGRNRREVANISVPPPKMDWAAGEEANWELWIELFSEEYHSSPVRVRASELDLNSVRDEVVESLYVAVPIMGFWLAVCWAIVTTARANGH